MPQKEPLTTSISSSIADKEGNSLIDNQNYLITDLCTSFYKEWTSLFYVEEMKLDVSPAHPFTLTLDFKYPKFVDLEDDLNIARVFLGIKDQQKEYKESIVMGVYKGRIFIKDIFDVINLPKNNLVEGVKIVLLVCPNKLDKKCSTTLKVLDQSGFELTSIKTNKFWSTDWNGGISTGAHFKSLRIEGIQPQR